jgi:hypothetical protein
LIGFVADDLFSSDCNGPRLVSLEVDWANRRHLLPVDYALELYGLQTSDAAYAPDLDLLRDDPTAASNAAYDYFTEDVRLSARYDELLERLEDEVFFVMFINREALAAFNSFLAMEVGSVDPESEEVRHLFSSEGRLKRRRPPTWARRAVYFREQGRCAACRTDLSPDRTPHSMGCFDHVVPLERGGLNDITNLQLLCRSCNNLKSAQLLAPSREYRRWYPA